MTADVQGHGAEQRIGARRRGSGAASRSMPWVVSIVIHAGVVVLTMLVAGTVMMLQDDAPAPVIVADFNALQFDQSPTLTEATSTEAVDDPALESPASLTELALPEPIVDQASDIVYEGDMLPPSSGSPDDFAATGAANVRFAGVSASNAKTIVFVIDASGSMVRSLQIVIDELQRSIQQLDSSQRYGVLFFQRDEALVVPPRRALMPASDENKRRTMQWIDENIFPKGTSNPTAALRDALRLKPDVIFILSENITGAGEYEIDKTDLLADLERWNPRDRSTNRRPTQINCIQFLEPDPLDTLREIAQLHGGPRGYKFLDRAELGLGER